MTVTSQSEIQAFRRRDKLFLELLGDLGELIISTGAEAPTAPTAAEERTARRTRIAARQARRLRAQQTRSALLSGLGHILNQPVVGISAAAEKRGSTHVR